ncbi:MAG: helix-turn-helix transcriptional regulator, partial [Rubrobacter sp.]|nr:helix-turn-helix transcriptional regulator [Rubrobacter sp.]
MPKFDSTHERILRRGLEIVSERGVTGVSIGGLAERAGLSKSGLFAHFRSKEDLQLEILRFAEGEFEREVIAPALEAPEGLPRLRTFFGRWLG